MDESRKRDVPTASAKNISSPLDEDFGNDFLSSWKLPKSGKDTIDFGVDSFPKSCKKFIFGNLDDFGLDGAFDKLPSFKMGMSDLDFSSPLKKKVKHSSSNGDGLSDGKKESEKDNFSFSFDFNELGKFSLDANLGIEEKSVSKFTGKVDPISSEGNKDAQRGLSAKASAILEDNNSEDKPQTQDVCTLRPSHPTNHESVKNASRLDSNINAADSSDKIQEHTSVSPAIIKQTKVDSVPNGNHREHPKEIYPTKAAVNIPSQNFSGSALSGEDPTQVLADPMNSKGATIADIGKVHISRESNDKEKSIGSQSKDTSTINPNVSGRLVGQFDSRNDVVEESVSLNEGSQGNRSLDRSFSDVHKKLLKKTSCGTMDTDEGASGLSSSMQREHKQANAGSDKCKTALSKTYSKPASHGLLTTSINAKGDRNAKSGLEPPSSGNSSLLNARNSTAHSTGHKIIANHVLLESSNASDSLQVPHSKDNKMSTISQLTGARIAKLGIRSPMSDRVPEKEQNSLQAHQRSKEKQPSGPSKKQRSALEKLQGATRSFTSPVPYARESPLTRGRATSLSMSTPEALKLSKTRSGRVVVPTLDAGYQRIVYDMDGRIIGVIGLDSPSPKGSKLKRMKRRAQ